MRRRGRFRQATVLGLVAALAGGFLGGPTVPVATAGTVASYSIDATWTPSGSDLHVGDSVTLTPVLEGAEAWSSHRCFLFIEGFESQANWLRMQVSSDACNPWTFVLPPAPAGQYKIGGYAILGSGPNPTDGLTANDQFVDVVAGTPKPFTSNYPVKSWALGNLVSDTTPAYGDPFTITGNPAADACQQMFAGGFEGAWVRQTNGCDDWTLTVPAVPPSAVESFFGQLSQVLVYSWDGVGTWTDTRPEAGFMGTAWSETYNVALGDFVPGDDDGYASNRPAMFMGPARNQVYYASDPPPQGLRPVVVGATGGECAYDTGTLPASAAVVDGQCDADYGIPDWQFDNNWVHTIYVELVDAEATVIAGAGTSLGFIQPMDEVVVDVPIVVDDDVATDITVGTDEGAPAEYEVVISGVGGTGALALGSGVYSGSLSPSPSKNGDEVTVQHAFGAPGVYDIVARFTDVKGDEATTSIRIVAGDPFTDVVGSTFRTDIYWLLVHGITYGCGESLYCPSDLVTRGQMASFIARALHLPATATDYFSDDESSSHEADINRLAAAGITTGCGPSAFCPTAVVKRDQMASFLARAFGLPATSTDYFTDDAGNTHQTNINRVRAAGITTGCAPNLYCPGQGVTRGQMAAFLHRAID